MKYAYARIRMLAEQLRKHGIAPSMIRTIMVGGEKIRKSTNPRSKAEWMKQAMQKIDRLLDKKTRYKVREDCTCSTKGKRLKTMKEIARNNPDADGIINAIHKTHIFGHKVERIGNEVMVTFFPEQEGKYQCVCLRHAQDPISVTYCHCCKGHVLKLMEVAMSRSLTADVISTVLSTNGARTCKFAIHLT